MKEIEELRLLFAKLAEDSAAQDASTILTRVVTLLATIDRQKDSIQQKRIPIALLSGLNDFDGWLQKNLTKLRSLSVEQQERQLKSSKISNAILKL